MSDLLCYSAVGLLVTLLHGFVMRADIDAGRITPFSDWTQVFTAIVLGVVLWPISLAMLLHRLGGKDNRL